MTFLRVLCRILPLAFLIHLGAGALGGGLLKALGLVSIESAVAITVIFGGVGIITGFIYSHQTWKIVAKIQGKNALPKRPR